MLPPSSPRLSGALRGTWAFFGLFGVTVPEAFRGSLEVSSVLWSSLKSPRGPGALRRALRAFL
eukprot:6390058-Alexandrium_andersonii.AAC.1